MSNQIYESGTQPPIHVQTETKSCGTENGDNPAGFPKKFDWIAAGIGAAVALVISKLVR